MGEVVFGRFKQASMPPSLQEQRLVVLDSWRIAETEGHIKHMIGLEIEPGPNETLKARVSSPIVHVDMVALKVTTRSGRTYQFFGEPSKVAESEQVWEQYKHMHGIIEL